MAKTFKQLVDEIKNKLIEKGLQIKRVSIDDEDLNFVSLLFSDKGASFVSDADFETSEDTEAIDKNCKIVAEVLKSTDLKDIDPEVLDHTLDYAFYEKVGVDGVQYDGDAFMVVLKPAEVIEAEEEQSYPYQGE